MYVCLCRDNFPGDLQFNIITRFMIDQTQSPSLKVREPVIIVFHILMSGFLKKPVFGVSDPVRHKPGCTTTEGG